MKEGRKDKKRKKKDKQEKDTGEEGEIWMKHGRNWKRMRKSLTTKGNAMDKLPFYFLIVIGSLSFFPVF